MMTVEKEREDDFMRLIGNLIWWIFGGLILALGWALAGLLLTITVIGIPFGAQCFKIAGFVLFPFGRDIELGDFGLGGFVFNILWIVFCGWELAIGHLVSAFFCALTVVGIPLAFQHLKLAQLSFMPFGAKLH